MNVTLRTQGLVQASLVGTGLLVFAPSHASVAATTAISQAGEVMLVNVKTGKCLTRSPEA